MKNMAKTGAKPKNKPKFFSTLLTLIFVAAGAFGVYKICTYMESNPVPAFSDKTAAPTGEVQNTAVSEETTQSGSNEAAALVKAIGEAEDSLSAEFLAYCADNVDAEALQTVLDAITDKKYDPDIWYTATGKSVHALNALTSGTKETQSADKDNIRIGFVGRVNLGGKSGDSVSADLAKKLNAMDIQLANNEFTFSADGKTAEYKADAKSAALYKTLGVDVVTTANTHIYDYGADGLTQTLAVLDEQGVAHIGAGKDVTEASKPVSFVVNGRKITFLAAGDTVYWKTAKAATASSAGILSLRNSNEAVLNAVKAAKAESDFVFVYMNAGLDENADWFDGDQRTWAKEILDAGADSVVGAHSNHLQGMEYHNGKLIVYGLGDFLFNDKTMDTGLLQITIGKDGKVQNTFFPCKQSDGKVALCAEAEKAGVFARVQKYCGNVVKFSADGTITANRG